MFSKNIITLYRNSYSMVFQQPIRYARSNLAKSIKRKREIDPGIRLQKKMLENEDINQIDMEELEGNFMDLDMTYNDHTQQMENIQEKEKYLIVKRKYFKEKVPNFLTYSDKQQIKYLYNTDPEMWTIEKLSEGFPALPDTIKKIIKANWIKSNENKIKNHDHSVQTNWKLLKEGKFEYLPQDLTDHLKQFTNRALNLKEFKLPENASNTKIKPKVTGEFSAIIESYENLKNKSKSTLNSTETMLCIGNAEIEKKPLKETYLLTEPSKFKNQQSITWTGFQKSENVPETLQTKNLVESENVIEIQEHAPELTAIKKYETKTGVVVKTAKEYGHLVYPEKISIPKKKWKKGHTYKLNDCYYDDDGEFLFRVPGLG